MSLETRSEREGGGEDLGKSFTGTSLAKEIITLLELSGQLFHQDAIFSKTPKLPWAVKIFHTVSPFLKTACGNHNVGLSPICWGFSVADEVWTCTVTHNPEDQPGQPVALCGGDTSMLLYCAREDYG